MLPVWEYSGKRECWRSWCSSWTTHSTGTHWVSSSGVTGFDYLVILFVKSGKTTVRCNLIVFVVLDSRMGCPASRRPHSAVQINVLFLPTNIKTCNTTPHFFIHFLFLLFRSYLSSICRYLSFCSAACVPTHTAHAHVLHVSALFKHMSRP
jgi:hypothetical protein